MDTEGNYNPEDQIEVFAKCMLRLDYFVGLPSGHILEPSRSTDNQFASDYLSEQLFYQRNLLPQAHYQDPQPQQAEDPFKSTPWRSRPPDNTSHEAASLLTSNQQSKLFRDAGAAALSAYNSCKVAILAPALMSECMAARWMQRMWVSVGKNVLLPVVCQDPDMIDRFFKGVMPVTSGMRSFILSAMQCESKA